jgi:hypothetical protein
MLDRPERPANHKHSLWHPGGFIALPDSHPLYPWATLLAVLVAMARTASYSHVFSHTYDEPYHIGASISVYRMGRVVHGVQHPPLHRFVVGLPLVLSGVEMQQSRRTDAIPKDTDAFFVGDDALFRGRLSYWDVLVRARLAGLVFPIVTLLFVYRLGRWLGGPRAGMLTTVFFSFDPTLLGHAGIVTTDVPAAAGFVVALYYGLRWLARPTMPRAALAGLATAGALMCKFSCLLVIPALLAIAAFRSLVLARRVVRRGCGWRQGILRARRAWPPLRQIVATAVVAFFVIWACYLFDVGRIGNQTLFAPGSHGEWDRIPQWVKNIPVPMPSLWIGGMVTVGHGMQGHPTYFNGQTGWGGWWAYFPEALVLKSPIGLIAGLALALLALCLLPPRRAERAVVVLIPAALFLLVSMKGRLNIGIRHILPLIPLLYLFVTLQLARGRRRWVLLALIGLTAVETAVIHPDYLAFFNRLAGGPQRGSRYLLGSNLDWGQDLARLAEWLKSDEAPQKPYTLHLFCSSIPDVYREFGLTPIPENQKLPANGLLAISEDIRHNTIWWQKKDWSWLDTRQPIKRIGYSIAVYDLSGVDDALLEPPKAIPYVRE